MDIKRIIVDELPKSCFFGNCIFPNYVETQISDWWECTITGNRIEGVNIKSERPSWCPLEVEDECEWIIETNLKGSRFEWSIDKSPHDRLMNTCDKFTFCPNCGKRIKYVESEE